MTTHLPGFYRDVAENYETADCYLNAFENALDATVDQIKPTAVEQDDKDALVEKGRAALEAAGRAHAVMAVVAGRGQYAAETGIADPDGLAKDAVDFKDALAEAWRGLNELRIEYGFDTIPMVRDEPDAVRYPDLPDPRATETASERREMASYLDMTRAAAEVGRQQIAAAVVAGWGHPRWSHPMLGGKLIEDIIPRTQPRTIEDTTREKIDADLGQVAGMLRGVPSKLPDNVGKPKVSRGMDI